MTSDLHTSDLHLCAAGVTHGDELIYLFPFPLMTGLNEEETHVSRTMTELWTNFAIHQ